MLTSAAVAMLATSALSSVDHAVHSVLPAVVAYTLRSTCVLLAAWMIAAMLRSSAAAVRHAVWTAAVVTVAVLPLLSSAAPPIDIPMRALPPITSVLVSPVRERLAPHAILPVPAPAPRVPVTESRTSLAAVGVAPVTKGRASPAIDPPLLVFLLWVVGTIGLFTRSIIGTTIMWRRALAAEPLSESRWVMLARDVAQELGIRRPVTLLMTRIRTVPMTWGIIYPVVLLPVEAAEWSPARGRSVLLHELAHVARFDAATQLLGQLVLAATWFNPLTWLAVRQMRVERERACDDVVLSHGTQASTYATDLLMIVRTLQQAGEPGFAALAMARHADLESRLRFILDARRRRGMPSPRRSMLSFAAAAPFVIVVAGVHPTARATRSAPTPAQGHVASSVPPAVASISGRAKSIASRTAHVPRVLTLSQAPPPLETISTGPSSVPLSLSAPSLPAPAQSAASTRCRVQAEFARGGVSAESGEVASLELENGDHRVLATASDGRCVIARLDGWVIPSDDENDVSGLGTGAYLTISDSIDGHVRRAEVSRLAGVSTSQDRATTADKTLYVIDGEIVAGSLVGSPRLSTGSGYPMIVFSSGDSIDTLKRPGGSPRVWLLQPAYSSAEGTPVMTTDSIGSTPAGVESNSVGGVIVLQYFVDGRPRSWIEGVDWFRGTLAELLRETGYDVQSRVATLRARGGVPAVLDEIQHVRSDMGLRAYFDALLASGNLSADDVARAITVAKSVLTDKSDRDRILSQLKALTSQFTPTLHLGNAF